MVPLLMYLVKKKLRRRFTMCRVRDILDLDARLMRRRLINWKVSMQSVILLFYLLLLFVRCLCDWLL